MKYRYGFLLFLFGFLLQSTVFKHLCIMGMSPNITLCLVILLPFLYGGKQGAVLGILFGLLQDLCFGLVIGPMAITYFLIALAMGRLRYTFYRDSLLSIFIAAVTGTVLYVLLYWGLTRTFGATYTFLYVLENTLILMAYHFVVMVAFYLIQGRRTIRHPEDPYFMR